MKIKSLVPNLWGVRWSKVTLPTLYPNETRIPRWWEWRNASSWCVLDLMKYAANVDPQHPPDNSLLRNSPENTRNLIKLRLKKYFYNCFSTWGVINHARKCSFYERLITGKPTSPPALVVPPPPPNWIELDEVGAESSPDGVMFQGFISFFRKLCMSQNVNFVFSKRKNKREKRTLGAFP